MQMDIKVKEQTAYLFNQIEPFLSDSTDKKDVLRIIFKILKVFYHEKYDRPEPNKTNEASKSGTT
jgi:hypothetical protein